MLALFQNQIMKALELKDTGYMKNHLQLFLSKKRRDTDLVRDLQLHVHPHIVPRVCVCMELVVKPFAAHKK